MCWPDLIFCLIRILKRIELTSLAMLFILFWTLTVLITWQSMGQKNLKLCSEDEQSFLFLEFERHAGKWIMTIFFILGWSKPLKEDFTCQIYNFTHPQAIQDEDYVFSSQFWRNFYITCSLMDPLHCSEWVPSEWQSNNQRLLKRKAAYF